jgi:hypothetical protein
VPLFSSLKTTCTVLSVLGGLGCTQPQTGVLSATWCHPTVADGTGLVMLDDMEDGDDLPCDRAAGPWVVQSDGEVIPAPDAMVEPGELLGPLAVSRAVPSLRAQHLQGTLVAGGHATLVLPLANNGNLSGYSEIDFWARSDQPATTLHVGVMTVGLADGDFYGTDVTVTGTWGDKGNNNSVPLIGGVLKQSGGATVTPEILASSSAIVFQLVAPDATTFGFWIDDVQLKQNAN